MARRYLCSPRSVAVDRSSGKITILEGSMICDGEEKTIINGRTTLEGMTYLGRSEGFHEVPEEFLETDNAVAIRIKGSKGTYYKMYVPR